MKHRNGYYRTKLSEHLKINYLFNNEHYIWYHCISIIRKYELFQELFEATLAAIQARVQLYGHCPEGYAARAASSIDVENFHGQLHRQHHHGAQTASVWEIEGSLSHLAVAMRLKKEPAFSRLLEIPEEDSFYPLPLTGEDLSQKLRLTDCLFDTLPSSNKNKEVGCILCKLCNGRKVYLKNYY